MGIHSQLIRPADLWDRVGVTASAIVLVLVFLGLSRVAMAATFTVNSTADNDDGTCDVTNCTLREAINAANADADAAPSIAFSITGAGVQVITPASGLPAITHAHVTINGYTQPGTAQNTLADGDNAVILLQIDGTAAGATSNGLSICADQVTIKGLSITNFNQKGIGLGVTATGAICVGSSGSLGVVAGNFIGVPPAGIGAAGNGVGVFVNGSGDAIIGGGLAQRNVISHNFSAGIEFINPGVGGTVVLGNYIGTDASGQNAQGNGDGVLLAANSAAVFIGVPSLPNRIAYNARGIVVSSTSTANGLLYNDIYANTALGIDLCSSTCSVGDGVTLNDAVDADSGGNTLQNYPDLTSAIRSYDTVTFTGTLARNVSQGVIFDLAFYANATCDSSGHGEGEVFLGDLFTPFNQNQSDFSVQLTANAAAGVSITATASPINAANTPINTSEFSACVPLTLGDGIFKNGFEAP